MTAEPVRANHVFGGYLVTQRVDRPDHMSAELLPARLLTASACIAKFVPDAWTLGWTTLSDADRQRTADALGLAPETVPALMKHVELGFDAEQFGWPNVVKSTPALTSLLELLPRDPPWVVLGLALHRDHVTDFLKEKAPPAGARRGGVYDLVAARLSLPPGGTVLGFEPLGFEYGSGPHSWLCNGLERECFRALGIRPNASGFIDTEEHAERATAHISRDDVGAEPVPWLPWMIVDYTS